MKKTEMYTFDQNDKKIIQLFTELGMPKNLAKTIMFISQVDECKSADIEQGANLRQPEVSIAMQELHRQGWIKKRDIKKKGKGRPVHIYSLTTTLGEILKSFEQEKHQRIEAIKKDLSELKDTIDTIKL